MRAHLSIIIPTRNAAGIIGPTLASLFEGVQANLVRELIISDGESSDEIEALADAAGARLVRSAPGRGRQLASGADMATGDWMLFIHADTQLEAGWSNVVIAHIEQESDKAGYFRLRFRASGACAACVAAWANFRSRAFDLPYGDQGLLISRRLYQEIGGYPVIPLMEDVAIADKLRHRMVGLDCRALTSAGRQQDRGWVNTGVSNLFALLKYRLGVSPERLASQYYRK